MCRRVNTEAQDRGPQKACFQGGPSAGIWELGPGEGPPPPPTSGKWLPVLNHVYRQRGQYWVPAVLRVWGEGGCRAEGACGTGLPVKTLGADSDVSLLGSTVHVPPRLASGGVEHVLCDSTGEDAGGWSPGLHHPPPGPWADLALHPLAVIGQL